MNIIQDNLNLDDWKINATCQFCFSGLEIFYKDIEPTWRGDWLNRLALYITCPCCKMRSEINKDLVENLKIFEKLARKAQYSLPNNFFNCSDI